MTRSDWMEGLLWAEEYIEKGVFFEGDDIGLDSLNWEVSYSVRFDAVEDCDFITGVFDYMKHYKERLL